ncbi:MAG TPA: hypothetical protein PL085_14815 [Agriterribacter sp.]|nr:hypothetical protein [Agriterribacter sp.]HRQ18342.1 hypothetical protein [Agriterribacter sp.]
MLKKEKKDTRTALQTAKKSGSAISEAEFTLMFGDEGIKLNVQVKPVHYG